MTPTDPTVVVIDDDDSVREALDGLLRSVGLQVRLHASVVEFLAVGVPEGPSCLILDVRLPGQSGLDLQEDLVRSGVHVPIIFITGHGDIPMSTRAMKAGALEFLTKPFRDQDLLDAIHQAIAKDRERRLHEDMVAALQGKYEALTPRERQVMAFVATGYLNKQIAGAIGVSEITVKVHRGQVMRKMEARSLADIVRMADKLGLKLPPS